MRDKREIVILEWVDASIGMENDQVSREEALQEDLIHGFVCGILIHEDKEKVILARDWFDLHDQYRGVATYPKSGIKNIRKIKLFKSTNKTKGEE